MKHVYTNEELVQRSPEWMELRNTKLGASTVSAILGCNKNEAPVTAFKRKVGKLKPKAMNDAMQRGIDMEDEALGAIIAEIKRTDFPSAHIEPLVCIHPKYPDIMVSFDGVDLENKFIVEAKSPKFSQNFRKVFEEGIPELYYPQVQLQLDVAHEVWGITKAYFGSYFPDGAYIPNYVTFTEDFQTLALVDADYDPEYCNAMRKVIERFMYNVRYETWDKEEYAEVLKTFKNSI